VAHVIPSIRSYWRRSSAERLLARRALVRSEPSESRTINEAAEGWAWFAVLLILAMAAVVIGFAVDQALTANQRAIPLLILGAVEIATAGRLTYSWVRFRRRSVGKTTSDLLRQASTGKEKQ
jgi:hypothetical protein